jgi:1-acyl-sn-glycerol-3-phosphate acyltransferase
VTRTSQLVTPVLKRLVRLCCRVDDREAARVPWQGPLILLGNHINTLDAPLLYSHFLPRPITAFAKVETWGNPLFAFLFNMWEAIPLRRGEADVTALRQGLAALEARRMLAIFPEGHRSGDGRLGPAHPGVVMLALHSGAPLLPVVHYGGEALGQNLKRLRRTDVRIVVGRPFYLDAHGAPATRRVRQQMADEAMYQLAALLPPRYRGHYANLAAASEEYLRFPEGSASNVRGA